MSCGCTSTATASPSITCGSCGYQCTSCVCPPDPIVMPTVTCADPAVCTEVYPLECVQYTGEDIKCSTTAATLYPNVTHIVATNGDMMSNVLNNINSQLCYIFSSDFINAFLNNINDNGELETLFCNLVNDCGGQAGQLICPTVSSVSYITNSSQNYLQAQFNYVPYATSYTYQFYTETAYNSGVYNIIVGSGVISQPSIALPIIITSLLTSTYTANKNYAVLVYAQGSFTPNGKNPSSYSSFTYANVDSGNTHCGINRYLGSGEAQTCALEPIHTPVIKYNSDPSISTIQFIFQQQSQVANTNTPITKYRVHWYLEMTIPNIYYTYLGSRDINFNALHLETINFYKPVINTPFNKTNTLVTVTSTAHGLLTGSQIYIPYAVGAGPAIPVNYYNIIVTSANTFTFNTANTNSVSGTLTYEGIKLSASDKVVVMVETLTADSTCFLGVEPRVNGYFTPSEIATYTSNIQYNVFKNF